MTQLPIELIRGHPCIQSLFLFEYFLFTLAVGATICRKKLASAASTSQARKGKDYFFYNTLLCMTIRTKPVDYIVFWICFCQFDDSLNKYGSVYARVTVPKMGRWAWEGRGFCLYYIHCFFCFCAGILLFMKWYQCWKLWGSWHFNWTPSYKRKHWWEQWRWWRRGYYFQPKQTSAVGSCFCHYPETG